MFFEQDYDEEALRADTILFWGVVGPRTGLSVVLAERPADLLAWLRESTRVEGRSSWLARALVSVDDAAKRAGSDPYLASDAIGAALEEAGAIVYSCGPLIREISANDLVRHRIFGESPPSELTPEAVWRGGESHREFEGAPISPPEGDDDEPAKGYRLDEDEEELAEHVHVDFERTDHRAFLLEQLEALKTPPPGRRAA